MITEKDMQYVLTIANYGNLTKAANALFLSQPALSIHLKQLETSLGIQLFERKGRRMILTYAGEDFVKSARDITMKCFELNEGDIILVEEGEPHELTNIGMGPAVITWSCAPSHIK